MHEKGHCSPVIQVTVTSDTFEGDANARSIGSEELEGKERGLTPARRSREPKRPATSLAFSASTPASAIAEF